MGHRSASIKSLIRWTTDWWLLFGRLHCSTSRASDKSDKQTSQKVNNSRFEPHTIQL